MASTLEKRSSASLSEKGLDRVDDRTLGENENEEVGETLHRGLQARQISMIAVRVCEFQLLVGNTYPFPDASYRATLANEKICVGAIAQS